MKPDPEQMSRFLGHAMKGGSCLELRICGAMYDKSGFITKHDRYSSIYSGWYNNPDSLMVDASRCRGVNVFVTLNPVNPALLGRANNKLIRSKHATKDEDIVSLRWLYIDVDAVRPADISSTQAELDVAIARRDRILYENPELATNAISGVSGNGAFIFVRLPDLRNTEDTRKRIARTIGNYSQRYSDNAAVIDVTTKNPARITVLPGTWKCKGDALPDRPHRQSYIDKVGHNVA